MAGRGRRAKDRLRDRQASAMSVAGYEALAAFLRDVEDLPPGLVHNLESYTRARFVLQRIRGAKGPKVSKMVRRGRLKYGGRFGLSGS